MRLSFVAFFALIVGGCLAKAPDFPPIPSWLDGEGSTPAIDAEAVELAKRAEDDFAEVDDDFFLDAPEIEARLADVLQRIWPEDGRRPLPEGVRVRASNSAEGMAGAWANGMIVVSAGLLGEIENEAQVAFLLGHELAHVLERHGAIKSIYSDLTGSHVDRMILSKDLERRADEAAYRMALDAGYAAEESVAMLRILENWDAKPVWGRIRSWESHPDLRARIFRMGERARKDREVGERRVGADAWAALIDSIRLDVALMQIEAGHRKVAEGNIADYRLRNPESGRADWVHAKFLRAFSTGDDRNDEILDTLEEAFDKSPEDADVVRSLGMELRRREDHGRALGLLGRYLELRPDAVDRKLIERYVARNVTGIAE